MSIPPSGSISSLPPRPPSHPDVVDSRKRPPDASPPLKKRARVDEPTDKQEQALPSSAATPMPSQFQAPPIQFPVKPLHRFQGASATIKRPREIAHFSYDDNHEYKEDDSGINYYCRPRLGSDLRDGFETFRHYEDKEDPHLDSLLKTLISKEKREGAKVEADFVTWRGMMTKIMTVPFDMFAAFDMLATLHDGTIYIEEDFSAKLAERAAEVDTPASNRNNSRWNPDQASREMMTYWGYKFEVLSLLPNTPQNTPMAVIEQRPSAVVSNHAQHCSIVKTAFGSNSLVLGGEVDGLWEPKSHDPNAPIPWIELKTSEELPRHPQTRDILRFERKLLKFWAQSFLLGVEKVIVGFRSKQGILRTVDVYDTARIPGMVRRGTACWDGNTCINFAAAFLTHLKQTITDEGVYRIRLRKKGASIEVGKVQDKGSGGILSEEFLKWRNRTEGGADASPVEASPTAATEVGNPN